MMEAVLRNSKLVGINGAGYGYISHSERFEFIPIPDQDVRGLFKWVEREGDLSEWQLIGTLADLTLDFTADDLPKSEHIGKLTAVDISRARPATVTRKFHHKTYDEQCLVTENIKNLWQAGKLSIGDYVLLSYIEEIPGTQEREIVIVTDKIYKTW